MGKDKKRTSQVEITDAFVSKGVDGVRSLLKQFPGAKQTFFKVIESFRDMGQTKNVEALESLRDELYGPPREYVTVMPKGCANAQLLAKKHDIPDGQVYIIAKKQKLIPQCYYKADGSKGKGTALYNVEAFAKAKEEFDAAQREKYREDYDPRVHVLSEDIAAMFPAEWELTSIHVSIFNKLLGIESEGQFRAVGSKARGKNLYDREKVERGLAGLMRAREEVHR